MATSKKPIINFSYSLETQPEMLERSLIKKSIIIGIPKEEDYQEKRIALTPQAVSVLVNNGQEVLIEHNAGLASSYNDAAYSEAGAKICYDKMEVFKSQLVLKTAPIHDEELELIQANQIIISPLNIPSLKKSQIEKCLEKQIIGISLADIKDDAGNNPIVRSLSQIAGVYAINIASQLLTSSKNGKGILLGSVAGVPPSRIVILGAGIVGFSAVRAALALGAYVQVFDNSITRLMHLQQSFGSSLFTSVIDIGLIKDALKQADVIIGCLKPEKGIVPIIVTEDMVEQMQPNSVIIDVSIDKGGCIETSRMTSHEKPTFKLHDVIHYCVPNLASAVPKTASDVISNVLMPLIVKANNREGGIENLIINRKNIINSVYVYNGKLTFKSLADKLSLKHTDIDLIIPRMY